jgi:DNA polymerase/3'-5' exonuclease PolX
MDYEYAKAYMVAERLAQRLERSCEKLQIAGSLRRRAKVVHDIEIVCVPVLEELSGLLGETHALRSRLDDTLDELIEERVLRSFPGAKHGPRLKQYAVQPLGIKVDLFIVLPPAQWGTILAIRTGPAHYSHWLVSRREIGGGLPNYLRVKDGAVMTLYGSNVIETPTEESFFALLGMDKVPEPELRQPDWRKRL